MNIKTDFKNKKIISFFVVLSIIFFFACMKLRGGGLIVKEISPSRKEYAVYIKYNNLNILFDTCEDEIKLFKSLKDNNLDIKKMDYIIISHVHGDHAGGLMGLKKTDLSPKTKILINENVYNQILEAFPARGPKLAGLNLIKTKGDFKIAPGLIYTDALIGKDGKFDIFESFIVIKKRKSLVVIVACSHPEIDILCDYAKKITKCNKISALIGGLGCLSAKTCKYLNDSYATIYSTHCSRCWDECGELKNYKTLPLKLR